MIAKEQRINDRYEIIRVIGEGGMANVYLAHDIILDRDVAVKVLRGDLAHDEKFVRRFQREALSASSLNHPNIVEMYDVGEDNGNFYIVMEYVDGKTLKQLIKKRETLTATEVVDIMLQLTDGLAHAHDSYIIHRDIKPQNIMILDTGLVKITDFGIAMALNATELTQTNSVMGSVHYLPPEQANGKGSTIKSDIYSLGILMFELLAGKVPFKGDNAVEIALKQMKDPIPSVKKINPEIPQSLENIIIKATAKNPKNRYNDAREMHQDLEKALDKEYENVKRIIFKYPENDLEETKVLNSLKDELKKADIKKEVIDNIAKPIEEDEFPKQNKLLRNVLIIVSGVLALGVFLIFILPMILTPSDVKIIDVAALKIGTAEKSLKDLDLDVTIKEKYSDTIAKGLAIGTDPESGRYVKKGTSITLYKSLGSEKITIADYVGKDATEEKIKLELLELTVNIFYKEVEDPTIYKDKENTIISQEPASGTALNKGDQVIFYVPRMYQLFPDMVSEKWDLTTIQKFCADYDLTLKIEEVETADVAPGTIISQSPAANNKIYSDTVFKIMVAKEPAVEETPGEVTE